MWVYPFHNRHASSHFVARGTTRLSLWPSCALPIDHLGKWTEAHDHTQDEHRIRSNAYDD